MLTFRFGRIKSRQAEFRRVGSRLQLLGGLATMAQESRSNFTELTMQMIRSVASIVRDLTLALARQRMRRREAL